MITAWNEWIEPLLGLAEIGLLFAAVYITISQFTRSRASSYIERFNSSDALESRVAVDKWLSDYSTTKARLQALYGDPTLHTHLRRFANLFQELGAAYQFGVAHRKTVRLLFDALVVMYWEALRFWVEDYRAQSDPSLYARFESLYGAIKSKKRKSEADAEYVIAYGSLMDLDSLAAALGRKVMDAELLPVTLAGWVRRWSIGEQVRLSKNQELVVAAFLNVERDPDNITSAAMIRVTRREMKRLIAREKNYKRQDVRAEVRLTGNRMVDPRAIVWCFVGRPPYRVSPSVDNAVILGSYVDRVALAAGRIDPKIEEGLRTSATSSGFDLVEGAYEFVDQVQASLV